MQKFKLFEKTMTPSPNRSPATNGASGQSLTSSPPSPADDPLDRLALARAELKSVSGDDEDTGVVNVSTSGFSAKGIPSWALGGAIVILALAAAAWFVLRVLAR